MKRRVQPLMARDTLGYQYTGDGDSSQMPSDEIDDDNIVDRLGESSRTCRRTCPAPCPSTPPLAHRMRSVAILNVEY
jgi:hypothetical protein